VGKTGVLEHKNGNISETCKDRGQESRAIAKMTARRALYTGALKNVGSP